MKNKFLKTGLFLVVLSLAFALGCGKDKDDNNGNNGGGGGGDMPGIIKPSELITLEDAKQLLGIEGVRIDENKFDVIDPPWRIRTVYYFDGGFLGIHLDQDALYMRVGGTAGYAEFVRKKHQENGATFLDGIGDWACIEFTLATNMYISYGDYLLFLQEFGLPKGNDFSEEEKVAWQEKVVIESGKLAFGRLKAIVDK
jgi:hypothetical protein